MARSRWNFQANNENPCQRSRRKKNVSIDNSKPGEGKRALYHCNYCYKDITGKIRIKCAVCPYFDLCVECFSVGAEVNPHKSHHPYKVMDNLSFPLLCPDWNADDELLLLEGIEMYGLGNWAEISEHVGSKSKELCYEHYKNVYINSPFFPLPDMSHTVGKNKKELFAMARARVNDMKVPTVKEGSPFSACRVKIEEMDEGGPSDCGLNADTETERRWKGISGNEGPSLVEMSGFFNPKRQEFDPEYDNDAEQLLAGMESNETDTEEEREIKLRILQVYSRRLDERQRRKDFVLERNFLCPRPFEKHLSPEERELCRCYDVFMRFLSKEDHDDLLQTVVAEYRMLKRIQDLKEARSAGCYTTAEADRYLELKRRIEAEDTSRISNEGFRSDPSSQGDSNAFMALETVGRYSNSRYSRHADEFDIMGFSETQLLSETEKRLCWEMRLTPPLYLRMQKVISREIFSGNINNKADARRHLFNIQPSKVDVVYDMLVKKGLAPSS